METMHMAPCTAELVPVISFADTCHTLLFTFTFMFSCPGDQQGANRQTTHVALNVMSGGYNGFPYVKTNL